MNIGFYGVRGSTPCPCDDNARYGGNTACVAIESPGMAPIIFDLGTGLRFFGETQPQDGTFRGTSLVTHLHWDHVQGLPFFMPINRVGAQLDIFGPGEEMDLGDAFDQFMRPPYFPVHYSELVGDITFHTIEEGQFEVADAAVTARVVPHVGKTFGYRVELNGLSVVYIPDHQMPMDGTFGVAEGVLALAAGADVLIHDAQYTPEEFAERPHWGHCTVEYAVHVARTAEARRLVLFHHDPSHCDSTIDGLLQQAREEAGNDLEVVAAAEGMTLSFDREARLVRSRGQG